jgi:hypothetical protein
LGWLHRKSEKICNEKNGTKKGHTELDPLSNSLKQNPYIHGATNRNINKTYLAKHHKSSFLVEVTVWVKTFSPASNS